MGVSKYSAVRMREMIGESPDHAGLQIVTATIHA